MLKRIIYAMQALLVIAYISYLLVYSLNTPQYEDYENLLYFLYRYETGERLIPLLLHSTQEHVNVVAKSLALVSSTLIGYLDLRALVVVGNLSLMLFVYSIYKFLQINDFKILGLVLFLLVFSFYPYNINTWGLTSVQHFTTLLFVLLALKLSLKNALTYQLWALIFSIVASLSFGNGILVFYAIILFKLLSKRNKFLIHWLITAVSFSVFYYLITSKVSAKYLLYYNPLQILFYALNLYGNPFSNTPVLAKGVGGFVILTYITLFIKYRYNIFQKQPLLSLLIIYTNLSLFSIIISRSHIAQNHAFLSNYSFLVLLNYFLLTTLLYQVYNQRVVIYTGLFAAAYLYFIGVMVCIPKAEKKKNDLQASFSTLNTSKKSLFWHDIELIEKTDSLGLTRFRKPNN